MHSKGNRACTEYSRTAQPSPGEYTRVQCARKTEEMHGDCVVQSVCVHHASGSPKHAKPWVALMLMLGTSSWVAGLTCPEHPQAIEISGSVRMYTDIDYQYNCHSMLEHIRTVGGCDRVNFVVTHFWVNATESLTPGGFCYRLGQVCKQPSPSNIARLEASFARCMLKAISLGFTDIWVTPHMDDSTGRMWRNTLRLDPYQAYSGQTYWDVMLSPISRVLNNVTGPNVRLYMSVQGEMNGALIHYPAQWLRAMRELKAAITQGDRVPAANVKVGVNNNYNKICGECDPEAQYAPQPGQFDYATLGQLYQETEFIALSAYAAQLVNIGANNLDASINVFSRELLGFGVNLSSLVAAGKQLFYTEFGLGGSRNVQGTVAAHTPAEVAVSPFYGIHGGYNATLDPWQYPDNLAWLQFYYRIATDFARAGGTARWKVASLFLWNYASYDVLGVHPISSSRLGSYQDRNITNTIFAYNTRCEVPEAALPTPSS